jgi:hypothetical protein
VHASSPRCQSPKDRRLVRIWRARSDEFRVKRLASLLHIDTAEASRTLVKLDQEQASFFRKAYGRAVHSFDPTEFLDIQGDTLLLDHIIDRGE